MALGCQVHWVEAPTLWGTKLHAGGRVRATPSSVAPPVLVPSVEAVEELPSPSLCGLGRRAPETLFQILPIPSILNPPPRAALARVGSRQILFGFF
jgi:hypothetical protein